MATYDVGDVARITAAFTDLAGNAVDPSTVTFKVSYPDGTIDEYVYGTDAEVVKDSTGNYHIDLEVDQYGTWTYRWESTGMGAAAHEGSFVVNLSTFGSTTLVVENGTGLANADSYISLSDATTYFSRKRLNSSTWNTTPTATRETALRMATAVLDREVQWFGEKTYEAGALRWPRSYVYDNDGVALGDDSVPTPVKEATAEMALWLLEQDRYVERSGVGLKSLRVDVIELEFDKADKPDMIPTHIRRMLVEYGVVHTHTGIKTRKLSRV